MSSATLPIAPQDFPSYVSVGQLVNYTTIAGLAWYAYEYFLTLPSEVEAIWKSKTSVTILLFLINRYAFIFNWALILFFDLTIATGVTTCAILIGLGRVANLLNVISISGIFILRTYAICERNTWVLGSLSLLFLARCGLSIWAIIGQARQNVVILIPGVDDVGNCVFLGSFTRSAIEIVLTVVFDASVFILTVSRTRVICRQAKAAGVYAELSSLLLRDGSLYFGILSVGSILDAVTSFDMNSPALLLYLGQLGSPLEVILTNRLILNLRTHDQSSDSSNLTAKTDILAYGGSRIGGRFQSAIDSVLGNIGGPLRVGDGPKDGEESETQMPNGEGEHTVEDGVDPLSLEGAQSERDAVNEGQASPDFESEP